MTAPTVDTSLSPLVLDGKTLTTAQIVAASRGNAKGVCPPVTIAEAARKVTQEVRDFLEAHWLTDEAPAMYGVNTGLGRLRDVRIEAADLVRYQGYIINSHSAGTGQPLSEEETRATIICRVNALVKGYSGLRLECLDRLLDMLNAGVHPVIPCQGSVGASGDLAPLAHLVSVMVGHDHAEALYKGKRTSARDALSAAGLAPEFDLKPKDVIAMINGSTISLAPRPWRYRTCRLRHRTRRSPAARRYPAPAHPCRRRPAPPCRWPASTIGTQSWAHATLRR